MNRINHRQDVIDRRVRQHAMTEVGDIAWPGHHALVVSDLREHLADSAADFLDGGEEQGRIEIALQCLIGTDQAAGIVQPQPPIDTDHVAARFAQQRRQGRIARGKMDHRHAGADPLNHRAAVRQDVAAVVIHTQATDPAIEELNGLGPGVDLGVEIQGHAAGDAAHHDVPRGRVAIHQALGGAVVAARAAFDRVGGQGKRRAAEADQRHVGRQPRARLPHGLDDKLQAVHVFQFPQTIDVGRRTDGVVQHGSFAAGEVQTQAHRLENQQQIGEQDRRIDAQPVDRLDHHLGTQGRIFTEPEKTDLRAQLAVLRQVGPACRMSQTGMCAGASRRTAFKNGLSWQAGNMKDER